MEKNLCRFAHATRDAKDYRCKGTARALSSLFAVVYLGPLLLLVEESVRW